jgi:hypothetical protein
MNIERCSVCDDPTGKAGKGEDSFYCECGEGPFCSACWEEHKAVCALAREMDGE